MADWVEVGATGELPPGSYKAVEVEDDLQVAVFNCNGTFYAIEDVCTHDNGELTGGEMEDCEIICPRHGARFDVTTGEALTPPAFEPVATFPVKVEDDRIYIADEPND